MRTDVVILSGLFSFGLAALLTASGCGVSKTSFQCERDEQCSDKGAVGRCEVEGFCSFPDDQCADGFRFGESSGELNGQCVGAQDAGVNPEVCLDITQLELGGEHTCALDTGGDVYCWGSNTFGQVGDDTLFSKSEPVQVRSLPPIEELALGLNHSCARSSDGSVWCWGANNDGRLGNASATPPRELPVLVNEVSDAAKIAAGDEHSCAVRFDGTGVCWGNNDLGELGNGLPSDNEATAVAIVDPADTTFQTPLGGMTDIGAGDDHTCAIVGSGVMCWGMNALGQLGNSTIINSSVPVAVVGLSGTPQSLTVGDDHNCVLMEDAKTFCWGDNTSGQLGNGTINPSSTTAILIVSEIVPVQVEAGEDHTCALTADNEVYCWGENGASQVGDGEIQDLSSAKKILSDVTVLGAGGDHTCARLSGGSLQCWGFNSGGQLADGSLLFSYDPIAVAAPVTTVDALVAGDLFNCSLSGGSVHCWGNNRAAELGDGSENVGSATPVPARNSAGPLTGVTALFARVNNACVIQTGDTAACWGTAHSSTSVNGSTDHVHEATAIVATVPTPIVNLYLGPRNTFVETSVLNQELYCWGSNSDGECGLTVTGSSGSARLADNIIGATQIANAEDHSCAIIGTSVVCYGSNIDGRLGDGVSATTNGGPGIIVALPADPVQIVAGEDHTCARLADSSVYCWGQNTDGQLGDGTVTSTDVTLAPVKAMLPADDALSITARGDQTCAIRPNNELWCWGQNDNDIYRTQSPVGIVVVPLQVPGVVAKSAALGRQHICVVDAADAVQCWGSNGQGQLGNARDLVTATPSATVIVCEP